MAMIAIAGGINAQYLLFDTTLLLITINFSNGNRTDFNRTLNSRFPEVEGPHGGEHVVYHQRVLAAYVAQLGAPNNFDTYANHSHFQYRAGDEFRDNLMYLCQFKIGYPCIPIPINRAHANEFNILYNRLMPPAPAVAAVDAVALVDVAPAEPVQPGL